jgi:hypothetical protein
MIASAAETGRPSEASRANGLQIAEKLMNDFAGPVRCAKQP